MAKNKKVAKNKASCGIFKKGMLCALLGTAMLSGGLLAGCESEKTPAPTPVGTTFYYGAGRPNPIDNAGKIGDFYIETASGDVWQLTDEGWIHVSNLRGPQGPVGPQGVGVADVATKSFCDADENVYMEITFTYSDGTTTVEQVYLGHTIYVGSEMTLEKAVEVVADGGEIMLTTDIELDKQITVNKKVEINLAGNTISNTTDIWDEADGKWSLISVSGDGELIITDSTGEGKLEAKENDCYAVDVRDGGKCVIEGGRFEGNVSAVYVKEGELVVNGGEFIDFDPSKYLSEGKTVSMNDHDPNMVTYTVVSQ